MAPKWFKDGSQKDQDGPRKLSKGRGSKNNTEITQDRLDIIEYELRRAQGAPR